MARRAQHGFTLVEIVVAITISAIVMVFVSMFITAPLDAYNAQSRHATLVAGVSDAWPRMEADLRQALPNSVRVRRNGALEVVEMLAVKDVARYVQPVGNPLTLWGTTAGVLRGAAAGDYLSINNLGTPGADAYALSGSMTAAGANIAFVPGAAGEAQVTITPAPAWAGESPRHRIYLVAGPVAYLCNETLGTLTRYSGYTIAANPANRDTAAEFTAAGAVAQVVAQGLTSCNFAASASSATAAQTVAVRLTTTAANGDNVTLLHTARSEYVP